MTTQTPLSTEPGRRLVRPNRDRLLAGVAAGLGQRFDLPAWLVRVLFVIAATFGGVGVIAYIAGWLLIPEEGAEEAIAARTVEGLGRSGWIGIGIALVGLMAVNAALDLFRPGAVFGLILVVIGVLVYSGKTPVRPNPRAQQTPDSDLSPPAVATSSSTMPLTPTQPDRSGSAPPPVAGPPVPTPPPPPPAPPAPKSPLGRLTVAAGLIVLGLMALVDRLGYGDLMPRHYLAAALAVTGAGLVVGAWLGRARGLIVLGIVLTPMLLLSPLAEIDYQNFGQVTVKPTTVAELQPSYRRELGSLIIDLSDVRLQGESVELSARVDFGELVVVVPPGADVSGTATVDMGEVQVLGSDRGGIGTIRADINRPGSDGSLFLTLRTDVGRVLVTSNPNDSRIADQPRLASDSTIVVEDSSQLSDHYQIAAGSLTIDLSRLVLDEPRDIRIQMGAGEIIVILPREGGTFVEATAGLGEVTVRGQSDSGFAPRVRVDDTEGLLDLSLSVGAGSIVVEEAS